MKKILNFILQFGGNMKKKYIITFLFVLVFNIISFAQDTLLYNAYIYRTNKNLSKGLLSPKILINDSVGLIIKKRNQCYCFNLDTGINSIRLYYSKYNYKITICENSYYYFKITENPVFHFFIRRELVEVTKRYFWYDIKKNNINF